jgi:triosephosphate isomerase
MLPGLATWTIVGHSERRRDAGETDALANQKISRAREVELQVILCVGEQLDDREAGRAETVVRDQVLGSLHGHRSGPWLTIAYEPVWAIGTGRTARGVDAAEMAGVIRRALGELGFGAGAEDIPVLYGGSVTGSSIDEFMAEPAIDGALVGGASLKPDEMAAIVARAGLTARARAGASSA